jgi:hypothetical protein
MAQDESWAARYRRHVVPRLREQIPVYARLVADGDRAFGEAAHALVGVAWRLGGDMLPNDLLLELERWIADQLFEAVIAAEADDSKTQGLSPAVADLARDLKRAEVVIADLANELDEAYRTLETRTRLLRWAHAVIERFVWSKPDRFRRWLEKAGA